MNVTVRSCCLLCCVSVRLLRYMIDSCSITQTASTEMLSWAHFQSDPLCSLVTGTEDATAQLFGHHSPPQIPVPWSDTQSSKSQCCCTLYQHSWRASCAITMLDQIISVLAFANMPLITLTIHSS